MNAHSLMDEQTCTDVSQWFDSFSVWFPSKEQKRGLQPTVFSTIFKTTVCDFVFWSYSAVQHGCDDCMTGVDRGYDGERDARNRLEGARREVVWC